MPWDMLKQSHFIIDSPPRQAGTPQEKEKENTGHLGIGWLKGRQCSRESRYGKKTSLLHIIHEYHQKSSITVLLVYYVTHLSMISRLRLIRRHLVASSAKQHERHILTPICRYMGYHIN
uniref:Uncharacterized protein n=1 Tax=Opuntia streptacantha TaxID=393608 RepID=A0A7C8ZXQ8_OPUST